MTTVNTIIKRCPKCHEKFKTVIVMSYGFKVKTTDLRPIFWGFNPIPLVVARCPFCLYGDPSMQLEEKDTLPPQMEIIRPTAGDVYFMDTDLMSLPIRSAIVFGAMTVLVTALDLETSIDKMLFYVDDKLCETLTSEPYEWLWDDSNSGKHTLKVVVYDTVGNTATDELEVWKFF